MALQLPGLRLGFGLLKSGFRGLVFRHRGLEFFSKETFAYRRFMVPYVTENIGFRAVSPRHRSGGLCVLPRRVTLDALALGRGVAFWGLALHS